MDTTSKKIIEPPSTAKTDTTDRASTARPHEPHEPIRAPTSDQKTLPHPTTSSNTASTPAQPQPQPQTQPQTQPQAQSKQAAAVITTPTTTTTPVDNKAPKVNEPDTKVKSQSQSDLPTAQLTDKVASLGLNDNNNNVSKQLPSEPESVTPIVTNITNTATPAPEALTVQAKLKAATGALLCWTPENKEGKKRYDRDFLMSFKEKKLSQVMPDTLRVNFPEILFNADAPMMNMLPGKGSMQGNYDNYNKNKYGSMGGDSYGKGSMNKKNPKGSMNMKNMNKGGEDDRNPPAVINLPEKIVLNTVENPYVVKKMTKSELNDFEELLREVRNILNKLTPQNLQKLTGDLINLPINNEDRLKSSIDIIFEKSIDEQVCFFV